MPAETLGIGEAVSVTVVRAAAAGGISSVILLTMFVVFMLGLVVYIKRK